MSLCQTFFIAHARPVSEDEYSQEEEKFIANFSTFLKEIEFQNPGTETLPPHPEFGTFTQWRSSPFGKQVIATIQKLNLLQTQYKALKTKAEEEKTKNEGEYVPDSYNYVNVYSEHYGRFTFYGQRADGILIFEARNGPILIKLSPRESVWVREGQLYEVVYHDPGYKPVYGGGMVFDVFQHGPSPKKQIFLKGFQPNRKIERALFKKAEKSNFVLKAFIQKNFTSKIAGQFKLNSKVTDKQFAIFKFASSDEENSSVDVASKTGETIFEIASSKSKIPNGREFVNYDAIANPSNAISANISDEQEAKKTAEVEAIIHSKKYAQTAGEKAIGSCRFGESDWADMVTYKIELELKKYVVYKCENEKEKLTGIRVNIPYQPEFKCKFSSNTEGDCESISVIEPIKSIDLKFNSEIPKIAAICKNIENSGEQKFHKCDANESKSSFFLIQNLDLEN